ncbi:macrophage mannose receptor 1-like isoform X1, partial [Biomphalaria glabrata]
FLNVLMGFVDNPAWIGLKSSEFGDVSDWQDNSRVNFSNWLDEQFQYDEGSSDRELCVQILGKNFFETLGKWYRGDCESKADYICETEKLYIPVVVTSDSTLTSIPATAPGFPKSSATLLLCPKKFQKFHTFCYLVVSHLETWDEARTSCEARGADLAKTEHILQLSKITLLLADYGVKKQAWIGIKQTNGSRFHWTDGKPVRRFFWRDEKNSFNSSGGLKTFCVSLFDSKWIRSDCNEKQPYICQTKLVRPTATVPLHNNQTLCKDGKSVQHGEYCYLKTKHQVSWSEADHVCRHRGMQLVSIHSNSQTDFLVNYTQHTSETLYYWIGLVSYKNGSFHWADGSSMTYINWDEDSSENSKHSDEKCAVMDSKKGRWYPVDCFAQSHGYICSSHAKNVNMLAGSEHLGSSISGGGVAAIVIVVLSACCLFIFAFVYAVRRRTRRPASDGQVLQSNGFDNRLYVCSDHVNEEESLACS